MEKNLIKLLIPIIVPTLYSCGQKAEKEASGTRTISLETLRDKIVGGWTGKMIGVKYGAPTEFKAQYVTYEDSIKWVPAAVKGAIGQDDIYLNYAVVFKTGDKKNENHKFSFQK